MSTMSSPNPPTLEDVLKSFDKKPGVTAEQKAQLRAAITRDPHLYDQLKQAAASGQLRGFELSPAPAPAQTASGQAPAAPQPPNLLGRYDMASGTVTLPADNFRPQGNAPSANLLSTLRVQEMSIRYAHSSYTNANKQSQPVTQNMVDNLQSTLNGSPVLAQQVRKAVTPEPGREAPLQNFASLDSTAGAGGNYNGETHTISLSPTSLNHPASTFEKSYAADLTFVLGHEIQHGFNQPDMVKVYGDFETQCRRIASSDNLLHDYTPPLLARQQALRENEAKAQIAGWNALLGRVRQTKSNAGLNEMFAVKGQTDRVLDFVGPGSAPNTAQARPGITFNPDNTLSTTDPSNVTTLGRIYFDAPPGKTRLGYHHNSDYANNYGAKAISDVIAYERKYAKPVNGRMPMIGINMGKLHYDPRLLAGNGISIPPDPTTGQRNPQEYVDTGTSPPTPARFRHTQDGSGNPPLDHQYQPAVPEGKRAFGTSNRPGGPGQQPPSPGNPQQEPRPAPDTERKRLLVMNGQRILQAEKDGVWTNQEVDKAGGLKPNFYNLYLAQAADKKQTYTGVFVHADAEKVYQQTGQSRFVVHARTDFNEAPEIGSAKSISYDTQGKANVSEAAINLSRGRSR